MKKKKINEQTKIRREQIIKMLYNDICQGAMYSHMMDKLMNDGYGINYNYTESTAKNLITDVRNMIKKDFAEAKPQMREQLLTQLYDTYTECREAGDRMSALNALKQIAKLTGADEADKFAVDCNLFGDINIEFGFDK